MPSKSVEKILLAQRVIKSIVALLVSAWIEITASGIIDQILHAAPLTGAWIEIRVQSMRA